MTRFSDLLNQKQKTNLAVASVTAGKVYLIKMDEKNGIKPKPGDSYRFKYFIVLGFCESEATYGGVIINSEINRNMPPYVQALHIPIHSGVYPFLHHDSFVDCSFLKFAHIQTFDRWEFRGEIDQKCLEKIIKTVQSNPMRNKVQLAAFGL